MLVKTLLYCMKIENLVNFSSGNSCWFGASLFP